RLHLFGGTVAVASIAGACLEHNGVQFEHRVSFRPLPHVGWQFWKPVPVHPSARLVKNLAQGENVGLRRTRSLGRQITLRPHNRPSVARVRHQADVSEFWPSVYKNYV